MTQAPYFLPVWETITTAWKKTTGSKLSIWAGIGIFLLIAFGLGMIEGLLEPLSSSFVDAIKFVAEILIYFLQMGFLYMGIRHAAGSTINFRMMFYAYTHSKILMNLIFLYLLQLFIIFLPILCMTLGIIYITIEWKTEPHLSLLIGLAGLVIFIGFLAIVFLTIRMIIASGFILDQQIGAWAAIKRSFKATRGNTWRLIGIFLMQFIIFILASIPLGIGLIWAIPFGFVCYGTIYKRLSDSVVTRV